MAEIVRNFKVKFAFYISGSKMICSASEWRSIIRNNKFSKNNVVFTTINSSFWPFIIHFIDICISFLRSLHSRTDIDIGGSCYGYGSHFLFNVFRSICFVNGNIYDLMDLNLEYWHVLFHSHCYSFVRFFSTVYNI